MKKFALAMLPWLWILLAGCQQNTAVNVQPRQLPKTVYTGIADTESAGILQNIWAAYSPEDRFLAYGGSPERPVENGPGDVPAGEFLTSSFFVPQELFYSIAESATLIHQLNPKLFSCGVLKLTHTQGEDFALVVRGSLRRARWQGSRPERYLIAQPREGFVLVAFGSRELVKTFSQYLQQTFPQGKILYDEPICVGIG